MSYLYENINMIIKNRIIFNNSESFKELGGIYMIQNIINGKYYIGSTKNFINRWLGHCKSLRSNKSSSIILQRAYNKYGYDKFRFIPLKILNDLSVNNLLEEEQIYLNIEKPIYNSMPNATTVGRKREKETIEKQKKSLIEFYNNLKEGEKCGNMISILLTNTITGETKKYRSKEQLKKDLNIHTRCLERALSGKPFGKKKLRHLIVKQID